MELDPNTSIHAVWYGIYTVLTFEYTAMTYRDLILCPTWVNMKNSITDQQNRYNYSVDPVEISFIPFILYHFTLWCTFWLDSRRNSLHLLHDKKFVADPMNWTGVGMLDANVNFGILQDIFAFVNCWTHEVNTIRKPDI